MARHTGKITIHRDGVVHWEVLDAGGWRVAKGKSATRELAISDAGREALRRDLMDRHVAYPASGTIREIQGAVSW